MLEKEKVVVRDLVCLNHTWKKKSRAVVEPFVKLVNQYIESNLIQFRSTRWDLLHVLLATLLAQNSEDN